MIPLVKPIITDEMKNALIRALESGAYVVPHSEEIIRFEDEFSKYCGAKYGVALSSGTDALFLALTSTGIGKDDEVITAPNSFVATANSIIYTGAKPVFADINEETYTLDVGKVEEKITDKTKAILPVHLYGHPADMDPLKNLAEDHNLIMIEDACQAHGAKYKGSKTGSLGNVACFSFYPSKNMSVLGEGGVLVTDNEEIAEKSRKMRVYGSETLYHYDFLGYNMKPSALLFAIAREQLKKLDEWNDKRRKNARLYSQLLSDSDLILPVEKKWAKHVYHFYVIRHKQRDKLLHYLKGNDIGVGVHYPLPLHLVGYISKYCHGHGNFPITEKVSGEIISLPSHPALTGGDINFVCDKIKEFIEYDAF